MVWNPKAVEAVRNDNYYVSSSNYIYVKIDGSMGIISEDEVSAEELIASGVQQTFLLRLHTYILKISHFK